MQWYKFTARKEDVYTFAHQPVLSIFNSFNLALMDGSSYVSSNHKSNSNGTKLRGAQTESLLLFHRSKEKELIYFFFSEDKEFEKKIIEHFKAEACQELPFSSQKDSRTSIVWGNDALWTSESVE